MGNTIEDLLSNYQKTVADCNRQIARLEPIYQKLGEIKSDFRRVRKDTEKTIEKKGTWRGKTHDYFCGLGSTMDITCGEYYKLLDTAQDAVNQQLGNLRAKRLELIPYINNLASQIEQGRVNVENALN